LVAMEDTGDGRQPEAGNGSFIAEAMIPGADDSNASDATTSVNMTEDEIAFAEVIFPDESSTHSGSLYEPSIISGEHPSYATSMVSSYSGGAMTSSDVIMTSQHSLSSSHGMVVDVREVEIIPSMQHAVEIDPSFSAAAIFNDPSNSGGGRGFKQPQQQPQQQQQQPQGGANEANNEDIEIVYMDDDELAKEDDIPVSYHNALVLNETYQNHLHEVVDHLMASLRENRCRQKELRKEIRNLESGRSGGVELSSAEHEQPPRPLHLLGNEDELGGESASAQAARKAALTVFASPYFKDINFFSHPDNPDTVKKKESDELDVYLQNPREWTRVDKQKLVQAVKHESRQKLLAPIYLEETQLIKRLKNRWITQEDRDNIMTRLEQLKDKEKAVSKLDDAELVGERDREHDWLKISVQVFSNTLSPVSCKLMWTNLLHLSINKSGWTPTESNKMWELVRAESYANRGYVDWDQVAVTLDTHRTGFQCLMRMKQTSLQYMEKRRWTQDEDDRLRLLVEECRIFNYIPWTKVAYYMFNRTKDQVYQRYTQSLKPYMRRGNFTDVEDCAILVGDVIFDGDWAKVADYIPHRTSGQIYARYMNFLRADFGRFSLKEDQDLLRLVKECGNRDWSQITRRLGTNRTRAQCRRRFFRIYNEYLKCPNGFSLVQVRRREGSNSLSHLRQQEVYANCEKRINDFLETLRNKAAATSGDDDKAALAAAAAAVNADSKEGYHITPNGIKIPKDILVKFIQTLKTDLPVSTVFKPNSKRKDPTIKKRKLDPDKPQPYKFIKQTNFTTEGLVQSRGGSCGGKAPGRKSVAAMASKYSDTVDRYLATHFRASWPQKAGSRANKTYRPNYLKIASRAAAHYAQILRFRKPANEREIGDQLLKTYIPMDDLPDSDHFSSSSVSAAQQPMTSSSSSSAIDLPQGVGGSFNKPAIRTYTRKRKAPPMTSLAPSQVATPAIMSLPVTSSDAAKPSTSATSPEAKPIAKVSGRRHVKLLAPNYETLIGFRGSLLNLRHLKSLVMPGGIGTKMALDRIAQEGIHHIDLFLDQPDRPKADEQAPGRPVDLVEQADKLLVERFVSMFFWPALMSVTEPDKKSVDTLFQVEQQQRDDPFQDFLQSGCSKAAFMEPSLLSATAAAGDIMVAAAQPFDASEIIEQAKAKANSTKPRRVYVVKKQTPTPDDEVAAAAAVASATSVVNRDLARTVVGGGSDAAHRSEGRSEASGPTSQSGGGGVATPKSIDHHQPQSPRKQRSPKKYYAKKTKFESPVRYAVKSEPPTKRIVLVQETTFEPPQQQAMPPPPSRRAMPSRSPTRENVQAVFLNERGEAIIENSSQGGDRGNPVEGASANLVPAEASLVPPPHPKKRILSSSLRALKMQSASAAANSKKPFIE